MAEQTSTDLSDERKAAPRRAVYWQRQIARARKKEADWRESARKVLERYRNERDEMAAGQRFNILYANTETIRPAIYAQAPKPDVRRRFLDKDPVARVAADVLQRALSATIDLQDLDSATRRAVNDYLLPGRAVLRAKYRPITAGDKNTERLVYQETTAEYVPWTRFVMLPRDAKNWTEVRAVAYGVDVTRPDAERQFGQEVADQLTYGGADGEDEDVQPAERAQTALVWEVWSKDDRRVYVVADQGHDGHLLPPVSDPLKLEGFFPQAEPLYSLPSNDTLVPRPEYAQYQDQAEELDDITNRITKITDQLRVRGIRDASKPVLQELAAAGDGELLAVEDWLAVAAQGGLDQLIAYLPIEHLAKVLLQLYDNRDRTKQVAYEITGVADIVRGSSNASETATAQGIKNKWAGIRIGDRQQAVQKFLRNLMRIQAEIIAEHFTAETLAMMTGIEIPTGEQKRLAQQIVMAAQAQQQPVDPKIQADAASPSWDEVTALLRQDKLRGFRIDVETDSTIRADAEEEQRNRTEMLTSITGYLAGVGPLIQAGAMPMDLARELLVWGVRSFRVGPQLEQALEQLGGEQQGASPQMQAAQAQMAQQQQQIAAQAQEIAKREQQATAREHAADMAAKDAQIQQEQAQRAAADAKHAQAMAEQRQRAYEQLQALHEQMEKRLETLAQAAEGAVTEAQRTAQESAVQAQQQAAQEVTDRDERAKSDLTPVMDRLEEAMALLGEMKTERSAPRTIEYGDDGEPVSVGGRPIMYGPDRQIVGIQ